jgi:hypothetical protein
MIDKVVSTYPLIVGIQIVVVDLQRNIKFITYATTDDSELKLIMASYTEVIGVELPLFTSDADDNMTIVDLINGEFICGLYKNTVLNKIMPEVSKRAPSVCATSIPPVYGKFNGAIVALLQKNPTIEQIDQLRAVLKELSLQIYTKEFK